MWKPIIETNKGIEIVLHSASFHYYRQQASTAFVDGFFIFKSQPK